MTHFCVPSAISLISGKSYDEITDMMKVYLGDQPIHGIYLGTAMQVLNDLGYKVESIIETTPYKYLDKNQTYLIHIRGHVGFIRSGRWFDNHNPSGTANFKHKALGILQGNLCLNKP